MDHAFRKKFRGGPEDSIDPMEYVPHDDVAASERILPGTEFFPGSQFAPGAPHSKIAVAILADHAVQRFYGMETFASALRQFGLERAAYDEVGIRNEPVDRMVHSMVGSNETVTTFIILSNLREMRKPGSKTFIIP